jgi:hypothetical protein
VTASHIPRLCAWLAAVGAGAGAALGWIVGEQFYLRPAYQGLWSIILAALLAWVCAATTPYVVNLAEKGRMQP